jgi:alpha-1,3/alpha-1,6-mannosyltransferase
MAQDKQHTVFFHPDLGIGGAERLVVDAAVALQERGHKVTIFTSHCDPRHCFDEARDGKPPRHLTTPAYASTRWLERDVTWP